MASTPTKTLAFTTAHTALLKIAAVLWVVWGVVHAFAGVMTIASDPATGFGNIADAVDPAVFVLDYPDAVGAVLNQHGWNLLWGGIVTIIGAVFIWRRNLTAIWVTAMVGGLLDVGYFLFLDLGGHVRFIPGTLMTLVSATAILLSGRVWLAYRSA
ncbi:MAG: hypothetical protein AAF845_01860 [Bacteroidota bacterium]